MNGNEKKEAGKGRLSVKDIGLSALAGLEELPEFPDKAEALFELSDHLHSLSKTRSPSEELPEDTRKALDKAHYKLFEHYVLLSSQGKLAILSYVLQEPGIERNRTSPEFCGDKEQEVKVEENVFPSGSPSNGFNPFPASSRNNSTNGGVNNG